MPDLSPLLIVAAVAVFVGAIVQGGVGFGLGLVSAPLLTLADPTLMPGAMLVLGAAMPLLILAREAQHADWGGLAWAFVGRFLGTGVGVWVVAVVTQQTLGLIVAAMVLVTVALSMRRITVPRTPASLSAAGVVSGITGTATAIGGPPIALIYQRALGPQLRATLAAFFFAGSLLSLLSLWIAGELPRHALITGLILMPLLLGGFALSGPLRRYLDAGRIRAAVLMVATASALLLIVRSLAGQAAGTAVWQRCVVLTTRQQGHPVTTHAATRAPRTHSHWLEGHLVYIRRAQGDLLTKEGG